MIFFVGRGGDDVIDGMQTELRTEKKFPCELKRRIHYTSNSRIQSAAAAVAYKHLQEGRGCCRYYIDARIHHIPIDWKRKENKKKISNRSCCLKKENRNENRWP